MGGPNRAVGRASKNVYLKRIPEWIQWKVNMTYGPSINSFHLDFNPISPVK